jgi:DNA-binding transcriptional ArsR family regulator
MPSLSIIPAAAVADSRLTDGQIRVLCAIGTFTNRLGGNVWASINTLAKASNLNPRTIQRAISALVETGYIRKMERPGRTHLFEIVLDRPLTLESSGGDTGVTPPPTLESPKRSKERLHTTIYTDPDFMRTMEAIWYSYPPRPEPYSYAAIRKVVAEQIVAGATGPELVSAVERYAALVEREQTEAKYVKGPVKFFGDETWRQYVVVTVHGRTRDEWARSGQDVTEWDRLAGLSEEAA